MAIHLACMERPRPAAAALGTLGLQVLSVVAAAAHRCYMTDMANFLSTYIVPLAIGAVAVVLVLGLFNMLRGGSPNLSQKLMRWRVILQFVAIVIIMLTVWAMGR
jgi:hypothetical protein